MRELGKYLQGFMTNDFTPYFLVCEPKKYSFDTSKMIPISRKHVNVMSQYGAFDSVSIDIKVSGLDSETMIALCLRKGDYQRTYSAEVYYDPSNFDDIPISGFPRKLMTEDSLASKLNTLQQTDISQPQTEKNFRGLVSRLEDPYIDHTMSEAKEQFRHIDMPSFSSNFPRF
jgi:hypothetical protein